MGVRLVRFNKFGTDGEASRSYDHDELINRDLLNQHPMYAITGLIETLNIIEDSITDVNRLLIEKDNATNIRIDNIIIDIDNINKTIKDIIDRINKLNVINKVIDTNSIDIDYDTSSKTLKADVKIFKDTKNYNAIEVFPDGLFVHSFVTKDTNTIKWSEVSVGESLEELYNNGIRFSHYSSSWNNLYDESEANAWYWDSSKNSFVQPKNTNYFTGIVTNNFYDYYTHKAFLKSTDSDNDCIGLIIGFVIDENEHPHTLSIICQRGSDYGSSIKFAIVYDFSLPDQQIVTYLTPGNAGSSGWSSISGIMVQVVKNKNTVSCKCSYWNSNVIDNSSELFIDMDKYSWGHLFRGNVRYGYCSLSQSYSYFTDVYFSSESSTLLEEYVANVKISKEVNNAIQEKSDGLYTKKFIISPDADNILEEKSNGYYVPDVKVSPKEDNAMQYLSDGLYVRSFPGIKSVTKTKHGFSIGDFIYYHPIDGYKKASAVDNYDSNIVGMVTKVIDENNFEYMWSGYYKTDIFDTAHGYAQGMPLYISDDNPGKVVQQQPDISKAVGYPVENSGLIISIERGIQYNQEASIGDFKVSANDYNVRSDGFIRVIEGIDYRQSLIERLLNALDDSFKSSYMMLDNVNGTMRFKNTNELFISNRVPVGMNLFIKAF